MYMRKYIFSHCSFLFSIVVVVAAAAAAAAAVVVVVVVVVFVAALSYCKGNADHI